MWFGLSYNATTGRGHTPQWTSFSVKEETPNLHVKCQDQQQPIPADAAAQFFLDTEALGGPVSGTLSLSYMKVCLPLVMAQHPYRNGHLRVLLPNPRRV